MCGQPLLLVFLLSPPPLFVVVTVVGEAKLVFLRRVFDAQILQNLLAQSAESELFKEAEILRTRAQDTLWSFCDDMVLAASFPSFPWRVSLSLLAELLPPFFLGLPLSCLVFVQPLGMLRNVCAIPDGSEQEYGSSFFYNVDKAFVLTHSGKLAGPFSIPPSSLSSMCFCVCVCLLCVCVCRVCVCARACVYVYCMLTFHPFLALCLALGHRR